MNKIYKTDLIGDIKQLHIPIVEKLLIDRQLYSSKGCSITLSNLQKDRWFEYSTTTYEKWYNVLNNYQFDEWYKEHPQQVYIKVEKLEQLDDAIETLTLYGGKPLPLNYHNWCCCGVNNYTILIISNHRNIYFYNIGNDTQLEYIETNILKNEYVDISYHLAPSPTKYTINVGDWVLVSNDTHKWKLVQFYDFDDIVGKYRDTNFNTYSGLLPLSHTTKYLVNQPFDSFEYLDIRKNMLINL